MNCRCMLIPRMTPAEAALEAAEQCLENPGEIVVAAMGMEGIAFAATAMKFSEDKGRVFRALVENWDCYRIVRETY